jgi:steroid 5-alpha reductase family enzyme
MSDVIEGQPQPKHSRAASFVWVSVAYALALAVAVGVARYWGWTVPWQTVLLADFAATIVVFGFSRALDNSSVYDPYWSVVPPVVALAIPMCTQSSAPSLRVWLVIALVSLWGARLTYNWARGWPGLHHEDWRYVDFRKKTGPFYWVVSFFGLHSMPTVTVFLGMLPLFYAVGTGTAPLGWLDALAAVVTLGFTAIEAIADEQLRAFRRECEERGERGVIMDRGLWKYCRHPNYLGEIGFWWGVFLFGLASDRGALWTIVGALWTTVLFVAISIPLIDKRSIARRPAYAEHMKRVPALIPNPFVK